MENTTLTKTRTRVRTNEASHVALDAISRKAIGVMGGASLVAGLLGITTLFIGLVSTGGPLALAKSWLQAVGWM